MLEHDADIGGSEAPIHNGRRLVPGRFAGQRLEMGAERRSRYCPERIAISISAQL